MTRVDEQHPHSAARAASIARHRPDHRYDDRPGHRYDDRPGHRYEDYDDYEHDLDDVARARAGIAHTDTPFGPRRRPPGGGERWRDFVGRYGWRAYALPVLAVITVLALLTTTGGGSGTAPSKHVAKQAQPTHTSVSPPSAPANLSLKNDTTGANSDTQAIKAAALPAGGSYTTDGKGTYRTLNGTSPKVGTGQLFRYELQVENGVTGVDLKQFQTMVVDTLSDKRSWSGHGIAVQRVDSGTPDFRVTLTSTMTVRKLCGYTIPVETSCYDPAGPTTPVNRVVINVARWVRGAAAYVGDLQAYRVYMINHEDGHALGHEHAHQCLPGGLAPVMMQQTFGLRSTATGKFCQANPWPYPVGSNGTVVAGAPGAEQQDTNGNNEYGRGD